MAKDELSKVQRLAEMFKRLKEAERVGTGEEALALMIHIINGVENELTSAPYDPERWQTDGRIYPPTQEGMRSIKGRPEVRRYRHTSHDTLIGVNGSIEIRDRRSDRIIFSKAGTDQREVSDL
jgi:hypothetical protein